MPTREQKEAFLRGLTALSRAHRVVVYGCGCCDSPCILDLGEDESSDDHCYRLGIEPVMGPEFRWTSEDPV